MQKGKIARLMDKGYGFITVEGQDKDLFFHANELQDLTFDDLREGDDVEFEIQDGDKGPNAVNVKKAGSSADAPAEEAATDETEA
jgi:CspA family cold shock protein